MNRIFSNSAESSLSIILNYSSQARNNRYRCPHKPIQYLLHWAIGIDRRTWKPIGFSKGYRLILFQAYLIEQYSTRQMLRIRWLRIWDSIFGKISMWPLSTENIVEHTPSYIRIPVWPEIRDSQHLSRFVDVDRHPWKPVSLSKRYRSIPLQTYWIDQQASIDIIANPSL